MDGLGGGEGPLLAAAPQTHIVGRRADLTRKLISPLMKRSFTRHVVLFGYRVVLPGEKLPADLGVRPTPQFAPLDPSRWHVEQGGEVRGSGARPRLLRNLLTGERAIFKNGQTSNLDVPSQGINSLSQPLRARAAALIATEVFGIPTPAVALVEFEGARGSLQALIPDAIDLSKLSRRDPDYFGRLVRSSAFQAQRSDLWILEQVIGNLDPQTHNILVRDPRVDPEAPLQLYPIDHDLTFPPLRRFHPLSGIKRFRPCCVRRTTLQRLRGAVADPSAARALVSDLLTTPEIDAMVGRMEDTLALIDRTIASRGESAVVVDS